MGEAILERADGTVFHAESRHLRFLDAYDGLVEPRADAARAAVEHETKN
jgi:hypothetical protein